MRPMGCPPVDVCCRSGEECSAWSGCDSRSQERDRERVTAAQGPRGTARVVALGGLPVQSEGWVGGKHEEGGLGDSRETGSCPQ